MFRHRMKACFQKCSFPFLKMEVMAVDQDTSKSPCKNALANFVVASAQTADDSSCTVYPGCLMLVPC